MSAVLLVEDDDEIREDAADILRDEGYAVVTARDGIEALAVVRTTPLCVVLLDLMMPRMDGWEFRRRMLADVGSAVPVVIMSGAGDLRTSTHDLDAAALLPKPFALGAMLELVGRYCAAARL